MTTNASARTSILAAVRSVRIPDPGLARYEGPETGADLAVRFAENLDAAGGRCIHVAHASGIPGALRSLPGFASARSVVSDVPTLPSRLPTPAPSAPRDLHDLDFALISGGLGVAESGAVWIQPQEALVRAAAFLAPEVALVLSHRDIVADLHRAYARIALGAAGFGCFVAGPSKTADIEQSLVIGAHGPRVLSVLIVGALPDAPD